MITSSAAVVSMIEQDKTGWTIDSGRFYVAGLSAGGAMATILGATYPELFDATSMMEELRAMRRGGPDPRKQGGGDLRRYGAPRAGGSYHRVQGEDQHVFRSHMRSMRERFLKRLHRLAPEPLPYRAMSSPLLTEQAMAFEYYRNEKQR